MSQADLFDGACDAPIRSRPKAAAPAPAGARVSDAALKALRRAVIREDCVDLGHEQLARSVYQEVAAILETVGARWHRGRKVHVFAQTWDRDMLEDVRSTGIAPPANPLAYFATPRAVADDLLGAAAASDALRRYGTASVLEPSAGTGALAVAAAETWAAWAREQPGQAADEPMLPRLRLVMVEIDPRRAKILRCSVAPRITAMCPDRISVEVVEGDFLALGRAEVGPIDLVAMNPPFSLAGDRVAWWTHLKHALAVAHPDRGVVACITPPTWRYNRAAGENLQALEVICRGSAWEFPRGAFEASGTGIATCGVVVRVVDTIDAGPLDTHFAEIVIENDRDMQQRLIKGADAERVWNGPHHDDPKSTWRRMVFDLSVAVARGGDMVSFAEDYQRRLSRALWATAADYLDIPRG